MLQELADKLRYSGFFLDVADMRGADRIVAIDCEGITHTWTKTQAKEVLKQLKMVNKAKSQARRNSLRR
jgi:hypothetical protein